MDGIELAIRITLVLHFIGLASLLGGFLTQMKSIKTGGSITPAIFHGAWTLLVTGFALTGMVYANKEKPLSWALAVKGVAIAGIFTLAYMYNKKDKLPTWVLPTIGLLTTINIAVATISGMIDESEA
ncbi:MAG: hypothetical protein RL196_625 [Actinomycetota bacterium]|jgi:hypothetical protein